MKDLENKGSRELKRGYTTGTCAAAASCGAAQMLFSGGSDFPCEISIMTPKGIEVRIPVEFAEVQGDTAICSVRKDSGDDPDVTNGVLVYSKVKRIQDDRKNIRLLGGKGIGVVTKPGLACSVGEPAINPVPRKMIKKEISKIASVYGYRGSLEVEISIPAGIELAGKTFNPKLGIEGGISVLGTSGIVEPMSEKALVDTIKVEMNVAAAAGTEYIILTPGNYGESFLRENGLSDEITFVKCSNFIGDALDYAKEKNFKGVLLIGHIGKLIKVAAGIMNTHSKYGDHRMEILVKHMKHLGVDAKELLECVTTEDAIKVIREKYPQYETALWISVLKHIKEHMTEHTGKNIMTEAMIYSNQYGYLGSTEGIGDFIHRAANKEEE